MTYPILSNTPIKEIIFSISYDEIVDKGCFENFIGIDFVRSKFKDIRPIVTKGFEFSNEEVKSYDDNNGFHLKSDNEVLQLRTGSFSYHYLNEYCDYDVVLNTIMEYWNAFYNISKDNLTVNGISVRYINLIEIDRDNPASHLVQLYPKQSNDRSILSFQNSVSFKYLDRPQFTIHAVSTQPNDNIVLLDITVDKIIYKEELDLKEEFKPLQEIKNKVFFDSITAKALIKYIKNVSYE